MSRSSHTHRFRGFLAILTCEVLFGLSYLFTKTATGIASPLALLGWRFTTALIAFCIALLFGLVKIRLKGKSKKPLLLIGLLCPILYFLGETGGIQLTTASESGTIIASLPVFSILASAIFLKKKPTRFQLWGILTTLVGVLITVFAAGSQASFSILGYGLLLLAVFSYVFYSLLIETQTQYHGLEITFAMLIMGAIAFSTLAMVEAAQSGTVDQLLSLPLRHTSFLTAILYQGIGCSIIAFFLSNYAIVQLGVNGTAGFVGISTVVSILSGVWLLGEPFALPQILGAVLILLGVYISSVWKPKKS